LTFDKHNTGRAVEKAALIWFCWLWCASDG